MNKIKPSAEWDEIFCEVVHHQGETVLASRSDYGSVYVIHWRDCYFMTQFDECGLEVPGVRGREELRHDALLDRSAGTIPVRVSKVECGR